MVSSLSRYRFAKVLRLALGLLGLWALYSWATSIVASGGAGPDRSFVRSASGQVQADRVSHPGQGADTNTLHTNLSSERPPEFLTALDKLSKLDDDTAIDLWQAALDNKDAGLRSLAWNRYRSSFPLLSHRTFTPQIVRFSAGRQEAARLAAAVGAQATVFDEDSGAIAAATQHSLDRLAAAGLAPEVLYPSISDMLVAARSGNRRAVSLYSSYLRSVQPFGTEVRIAVLDLSLMTDPEPGYSTWLGDGEDFLLKSERWIAYLDVFATDGSAASIKAHIDERYTKRGYSLAGFYTPADFSSAISSFFPGKSFNPGGAPSKAASRRADGGGLVPELSNGKFHS